MAGGIRRNVSIDLHTAAIALAARPICRVAAARERALSRERAEAAGRESLGSRGTDRLPCIVHGVWQFAP